MLHTLARTVVPPPRLRAKQVFFSAVLRLVDSGQGRGLGGEFWKTRALRIPAKVGLFDAKESIHINVALVHFGFKSILALVSSSMILRSASNRGAAFVYFLP